MNVPSQFKIEVTTRGIRVVVEVTPEEFGAMDVNDRGLLMRRLYDHGKAQGDAPLELVVKVVNAGPS